MRYCVFTVLMLFNTFTSSAQYHQFSHGEFNLGSQKIIKTKDNGFLLISHADCYTPGAITIEGCPRLTHIVKTDESGNTQWTKEIPYHHHSTYITNIFENADGTFTFFGTADETLICDDIFTTPLLGFSQVSIINMDQDGNLSSVKRFPDNCSLYLRSITRLEDNLYAILVYYSNVSWDQEGEEGRLLLIDRQGEIQKELLFDKKSFYQGKLNFDEFKNELILMNLDSENQIIELQKYDTQLNLISSINTTDPTLLPITTGGFQTMLINNGDNILVYRNSRPWVTNDETILYVIDDTFGIIQHKTYALKAATHFAIHNTNFLINASENLDDPDRSSFQVNLFNLSGDSLSSIIINQEGIQKTEDIIASENKNQIAVAGSINCCNLSIDYGPSDSFLWINEITLSNKEHIKHQIKVKTFPNPAISELVVEIQSISNNDLYNFHLYSPGGISFIQQELRDGNNTISLKAIPPGVYFYTVFSKYSEPISGKIIKKQ